VPINSGPPQAEATSESGGLLCKDYMDTLTYSFLCCPHHHYWWVSYPPYPYFIVSSFLQVVGWPLGLSITHCVHPMF
jgi:hypothetical protein